MKPDEFKIRFQEDTPIELPETNARLSSWQHAVRSNLCFGESDIVLTGKVRDDSADNKLLMTSIGSRVLGLLYKSLFRYTLKDRKENIPNDSIDKLVIAGEGDYHVFNLFQELSSGKLDIHVFFTTRNRDLELVEKFRTVIPKSLIEEQPLPWTYKTVRW